MNSEALVDNDINNWKTMGMTKAELVVLIAEECLGWPYVYGERGAYCTPAKRRSRADALDAGMPAARHCPAAADPSRCWDAVWTSAIRRRTGIFTTP